MKKNLFRKFLALFLTGTLLAGVGCKDYDDDIDDLIAHGGDYAGFISMGPAELPPETLRMVSVLGGGVAGSGCLCGALNGACLVLGCLVGRTTPEEKTKAEVNQPVREFQKIWLDRFHTTCCRVLKSPANGGPVSCGDLMADTSAMLIDFIREKKLA